MFEGLHKFASPPHFHAISRWLSPTLYGVSLLLFALGLVGGLVLAPADYQQGDSFRIIYIHVPSAWLSMFVYMVMAGAGACGLIWKMKMGDIVARAAAPLGASFTFLALVTGSLWGKPMWGAWWVWDARLTSELILLFLYLGYIALQAAIEDRRVAARTGAVLAIVGVVNIPIIHYSVEWWSTLHQGPTVTKFDQPSIATSMLIPLLTMTLAFKAFFIAALLVRTRCEILEFEQHTSWVRELVRAEAAR
ncbi:MAG TPA: heme ABC transporter permease [Gammaproteobacteria bacterium]|nr:heme ABC transporter permease [Gammaproteobacteria bacterium]